MNIIDYINSNPEKPLDLTNEVDALILSMASYFEFEDILELNPLPIAIKDLNVQEKIDENTSKLRRQHNELILALINSPRFNEIMILDFEATFDIDHEHQFAGITFKTNDELFVAFRGTDFSPIGWKEDFNMSFTDSIPAQHSAINFLNKQLDNYDFPITVGGHSKGGHLSVYASAFCSNQERIRKVFNFDGPGFNQSVLETQEYKTILYKTVKYIPRASIIGLLLESEEFPIIIDSRLFGFLQHDAFEWRITENGHFIYKENLTASSQRLSQSLQTWSKGIDNEKREYVINQLFGAFNQLGIESLEDTKKIFSFETIKKTLDLHNNADPEFKDELNGLISSFVKLFLEL